MFLRIFNSYRAVTLILIILIGCGLWQHSFSHPVNYSFSFSNQQMPLYRLIMHVVGSSGFFSNIVSLIIILTIGIILNLLNTHFIFIPERTYLPALFFFLIAESFTPLNILNPVIFASFFLILAINRIFGTFKTDSLCYNFFDASFLIGIASLIYFPSVFFIVLIWITLLLMRPFHWREWLYSILGIAVIYGIVISIYFLMDKTILPEIQIAKSYFNTPSHDSLSLLKLIMYGYIGIIFILASANMIRLITQIKIQARKAFQVLLGFFVLSLLLYFIPGVQIEIIILIAIPLSYLFSYYFISFRKIWIGEIMFLLLIGLVILNSVK